MPLPHRRKEAKMARDLAIDVHKRTLFVVAADAEGVELRHRRFPTTLEGEAQLLRELGPEDRVVPAAQQLMQIDGFGAPTAVMWLGEVGEVARFGSAAQLVS